MQNSFPNCLSEIIKTSRDIWSKGWAEANAGNISVRLDPEIFQTEVAFEQRSDWIALGMDFPVLAGECFLVSGRGKYLRNIELSPEKNIGVIELDNSGRKYRVLWGYESGGGPTSELLAHLKAHAIRKKVSKGVERAVIHVHSPNLITLTYGLDLDTPRISKLLWEMHAECIVMFPEGVEFVLWMLPGSSELADATAKGLKRRRIAVWQFHGVVATGRNLDAAFGLIDVAEKAAENYLKTMAGGGVKNKLTTQQLQAIVKHFNLKPDTSILNMEI